MNTKELTTYKPYALGIIKNDYADIFFENEGIMTVPKNSAAAIVDLLNDAFKNGVKMTIKSFSMSQTTPVQPLEANFKSKPMPLEEPHPINSVVRKK